MACTRQGAEVWPLRGQSLRRALQVKPGVMRVNRMPTLEKAARRGGPDVRVLGTVLGATIVFAFVKIPVLGWSIRTVAPAFGIMYFGFIEGVFGGWIGYMLSTLIVGGYEDPLMMLPTSGIGDMVSVALFGLIYWAIWYL